MKTTMTFDEAFIDLSILVIQIESEKVQIATLAEKIEEANKLIKYCETKLRTIEKKTMLQKSK